MMDGIRISKAIRIYFDLICIFMVEFEGRDLSFQNYLQGIP